MVECDKKQCLIEIKADLLQDYMEAVEGNQSTRATFIRGKLAMLDQILKEVI
jgi:hypothetical protein